MFSYWKRRRSATKPFNIVLLDGSTVNLQLESRCTGSELIRRVLESQRILSNQEIFGLTTLSGNCRLWLNLGKAIKKQIPGHSPYTVHLCIWVYPRDHHNILQSATRHQLYLQVKHDLLHYRLKVSNDTLSETLAGYIVQREIGDFSQQMCGEGYIQDMCILPNLTRAVEEAVAQQHRVNRGCSTRDCEEQVLNRAQGEFTYGTYSYTVQDAFSKRSTLQLSVCPIGVRVHETTSAVITYEWEVIERVSHKAKHLYIDLINNTKSPPPLGPTQFTCGSSQIASNLAYWCSLLREYHTQGEVQRSKSRLKRFFSSRRSMRRRPPVSTNESNRRSSGVIEERRSSLSNDPHYTTVNSTSRISISSPSTNSESKGLVVYGASGLASQDQANHNHSSVTEAVVHEHTIRAKSEEPMRSYDISHFMYDLNNQSHDRESPSHDPFYRSRDLDSPEIKTVNRLSNHRNDESHKRKLSHDTSTRSHDNRRLSQGTPTRTPRSSEPVSPVSHDMSSMSQDSHVFKRYELGPQRTSSRSHSSSISNHHDDLRSPDRTSHSHRSLREQSPAAYVAMATEKARSLNHQVHPNYTLAEDQEWVGLNGDCNEGASQDAPRIIDPAAKPKNRIRLSLPESSYYDCQGRRGTRLSMSGRRSRNTTISSTTSLSQPMDNSNWGLSSKLGSIASLEAQASLAELSQADSPSFIDPHMRSFVFQATQHNAGTEL